MSSSLTPKEAALLLALSKRQVLDLIRRGSLKAIRVNRRVIRIPESSISEWLGKHAH